MTPSEKKLEKLQKLLEIANEDFARPEEVIEISKTLLEQIVKTKAEIVAKIDSNKNGAEESDRKTLDVLKATESRVASLIATLSKESRENLDSVRTQVKQEVKRLEKKIPTKTDLSDIEREIQSIKESFNTLPTELTINNEAIRDGLELLKGDERLDKSAIKGLDDYDELILLARTPKDTVVAGVRLLRYLSDVNITGITNGQTLVWNSTTNRFDAGSAGGSGGHTIQDEGVSLIARTNLNFVGAGVTVTDGGAGPNSTVVAIPSGGGTPGGLTTQIQYNNAGTFAGSNKLEWVDATHTLTIGEGLNDATIRYEGSASLYITAAGVGTLIQTHSDGLKIAGGVSGVNRVVLKTTLLTVDRQANFPDKDGTIAMTSDIPVGAFTALVATGTVNSINTVFTFTQVPSYIVADGVWFKPVSKAGTIYWTNVTTTVTMVNPPSDDIFGVA